MFPARQVVFQTKVYHPGINEEGSICVPILRDEVSPRISLDLNHAIASWKGIADELLLPPVMRTDRLSHQWKPSITLSTGKPNLISAFLPCSRSQTRYFTVLAIVQEKLNNPSADDPYDADIAAVSSCGFSSSDVATSM